MEVLDYLRGRPSFYSSEKAELVIRSLTGVDPHAFYSQLDSSAFYAEMRAKNEYLLKNKLGNVPIETEAKFLYALCRAFAPVKVVETGPGTGVSSSFILKALQDNSGGEMWSIEAGALRIVPLKLEFGQFIPSDLRGRWHLLMGQSKDVLPDLLYELESIDLFFHDSDHGYDNMMWEFESAWPRIRAGGLLCADDVNYNSSFKDFCARHRAVPERLSRFSRFGIVKKVS
ncbi:MAG: class I SAM-dependent methyltransferase [Nitrososphaerota archaeon]|nr:class I SAM-dependent methyltransferase [Nitrososphaerota archaeon]